MRHALSASASLRPPFQTETICYPRTNRGTQPYCSKTCNPGSDLGCGLLEPRPRAVGAESLCPDNL
eukprot:3105128-Lingulodinium_polyedra.AAC.1